ncbi:AAA domain-containing protein [Corynebacterium lubricantis]|uniref:AAA domain-containing protein n=1 Tax=Corynebacterium lubricantis TaxID=541095 RepID=UPI000367EB96|nr:AAA domain-containing protein [Corynebacterium lubricantis]
MASISDKASRLFKYLSERQRSKEKTYFSTGEYAKNGGAVLRLEDLTSEAAQLGGVRFGSDLRLALYPEHEELESSQSNGSDADLIASFERPDQIDFPELDAQLAEWLSGAQDNPHKRPVVLQSRENKEDLSVAELDRLNRWLEQWDLWALSAKYQELYQKAFDIHMSASQKNDEFELVLGLGNLGWQIPNSDTIDKHVFSIVIESELEKQSGNIYFRIGDGSLHPEFDAVLSQKLADASFLNDVERALEDFDGALLSEESFSELGSITVNGLSTNAVYDPRWQHTHPTTTPTLSWEPTIVMRPRQRAGLSTAFAKIADDILESGHVPPGLVTLLDPNAENPVPPSSEPGAVLDVDGEIFTPLPLNRKQRDVLQRVDSHAQTIVQGPPGTGKTHMAAALVSHLLAQGMRVLVTAEADRALYELRGKLPEDIRELAVSMISSNQDDLADLKVAVETINRRSQNFNPDQAQKEIRNNELALKRLQEQRTDLMRRWTDRMDSEHQHFEYGGQSLTMAQAVEAWQKGESTHRWIKDLTIADLQQPFPLTQDEIEEWIELLDDDQLRTAPELQFSDQFDLSLVPTPTEFRAQTELLASARKKYEEHASLVDEATLDKWRMLGDEKKAAVQETARELVSVNHTASNRTDPWMSELRADASQHQLSPWRRTLTALENQLAELGSIVQGLAGLRKISVDGAVDSFVPSAQALLEHVQSGGEIKTKSDGTTKIGLFTPRVVKESQDFLEKVRVDGMPPTTAEQIAGYLGYVNFVWSAERFQREWTHASAADISSPMSQFEIFQGSVNSLRETIELYERISSDTEQLRSVGIKVDLERLDEVISQPQQLEAASTALDKATTLTNKLHASLDSADVFKEEYRQLPWVFELVEAVSSLDPEMYETAYSQGQDQSGVAPRARHRITLGQRVAGWSKDLSSRAFSAPLNNEQRHQLRNLEAARQWALLSTELESRNSDDVASLHNQIAAIDQKISRGLSTLASHRAWSKAVDPSRIDRAMSSNLVAYSQAVKRLGKGTGKYAERRRRDIRKHLESSRSAVPVWIMPIYKVVEQFQLEENMFDVVIVDEASQAGVDSVFLQYLAPRIVVIGDDKQVSPAAVGTDLEALNSLASQFLSDFDKIDSWTDPKLSLFDAANMWYGGRIVLDEHRRSVPEIIEFSNQLVYRPENIELRPVREIKPGRLAPFKITRTPNAFYSGTKTKRVNEVEAQALVERIAKVFQDPAYDGKTLGVISLLNTSGQAKYIQARLLNELEPAIWEDRDLKVGGAEDFQGAERDVIFLSMVQPSTPGERIHPQSTARHEQLLNVAVSRAKDQVWLFHSAGLEDLNSELDLRANLLQYAYSVAESAPEASSSNLVSNDEPVEPFDSLFEQRVYNMIVTRGYQVIPQFDAFGYKIDLVVQGTEGRLAVECDGDHWHGDQNARSDQARQRDLERLGWNFVRIFESDFYLNQDFEINRVFTALDSLGIQPFSTSSTNASETQNIEVIEEFYADSPTIAFHENDIEPEDAAELSPPPVEVAPVFAPAPTPPPKPLITNQRDFSDSTLSLANLSSTKSASIVSEYVEFSGTTVPVAEASPFQIEQGILQILQVEGPMIGELIHTRYVRASGFVRVTKSVSSPLNQALSRLINDKSIHELNDGKRLGYKDRTFYLPGEPSVVLRDKGPRSISEIPHEELRELMREVFHGSGARDQEELMRLTLAELGFKKLTKNTEQILRIHYDWIMAETSN